LFAVVRLAGLLELNASALHIGLLQKTSSSETACAAGVFPFLFIYFSRAEATCVAFRSRALEEQGRPWRFWLVA
jgi:hypothetical protein